MGIILVANSTPIVDFSSTVNVLRVKRDNKFDLPTPESPTKTILNNKSKGWGADGVDDDDDDVVDDVVDDELVVFAVVFDVTRKTSFDNIPRWLRELRDHANKDIVLILVGNKSDLVTPINTTSSTTSTTTNTTNTNTNNNTIPNNTNDEDTDAQRQVNEQMAQQMAKDFDIPYIETSAKSGINVEDSFVNVVTRIYQTAFLNKNADDRPKLTNQGSGLKVDSGEGKSRFECCLK